jgi:hypothetical protein
MAKIEQIAAAALAGDALLVRSLAQDFLQEHPDLSNVKQPATNDIQLLAATAALLELFALRTGQEAPAWTKQIGPTPEPVYLVKSAASMKRLRALCEAESPAPLRKRQFFAPPNYLEFA